MSGGLLPLNWSARGATPRVPAFPVNSRPPTIGAGGDRKDRGAMLYFTKHIGL